MARLNETEQLIKQGARESSTAKAMAFNKLIEFYEGVYCLNNDDNVYMIYYLYKTEHKRKTYDCIAQKLCVSLSKLENKRREFQKMFKYFYDKI